MTAVFEDTTTTTTEAEAPAAPSEVERYKERVREYALQARDSQGWDQAHLNKTLIKLGLEPEDRREGVIRVTATHEYHLAPNRRRGETNEQVLERLRAMTDEELVGSLPYSRWQITTRSEPVMEQPGVEDAEAHPDAFTTDLDTYKKLVRRTAFAVAKDNSWCDSGLNEYLGYLGLPEKRMHSVPVEVTTRQVQWMNVADAIDADEARELVEAEPARVERFVRDRFGATVTVAEHQVVRSFTFAVGDPDHTYSETNANGGAFCRQRHSNADGNWSCTRPRHHDGDHAAGDADTIKAVWPQEG